MTTGILFNTHKAKVQSQRARVMLSMESPHDYHRIDSLGLNLACEGILLGMWAGGHWDPRAGVSPS
jgi:hypothetical protein